MKNIFLGTLDFPSSRVLEKSDFYGPQDFHVGQVVNILEKRFDYPQIIKFVHFSISTK